MSKRTPITRVKKGTALSCTYRDPYDGEVYSSRRKMDAAIRARSEAILRDFEDMLAGGTLRQLAWDPLPGETNLLYDRFRRYAAMPISGPVLQRRSVEGLARVLNMNADALREQGKKWYWKQRAEAHDRELDRQAELQFLEDKRTSARRQAALGQRLQAAAHKGVDILLTGAVDMSAGEVARLAAEGVKIERLAMDKATSHEATVTRFVYEGVKPKWADHAVDVEEVEQVEAGPLQQRLRDIENSQPRPKDAP